MCGPDMPPPPPPPRLTGSRALAMQGYSRGGEKTFHFTCIMNKLHHPQHPGNNDIFIFSTTRKFLHGAWLFAQYSPIFVYEVKFPYNNPINAFIY
jgi:hypothetical protein